MPDKPIHPGQLINLIDPDVLENPYFKHRRFQAYYAWEDHQDFKTWHVQQLENGYYPPREYKTTQRELLAVVVEVWPYHVERKMEIQTQDSDGDPVDKVATTFLEYVLVKVMLPCSGLKWVGSESVYSVA